MAKVVKYSLTIQPNTVYSYPFVVGVNQSGYGSTSATNYYNGKTPNVGGYVVYKVNGTNSPPYYAVANDNDLITLSNQLGLGGTNYNIGMALETFMVSGSYCCVNVDYSNIVTSGLILNLDAGYTPSYPKDYLSWRDISGYNNNGVLANSPTYSGGSIVFDGTDDVVNVTTTFGTYANYSICYWAIRDFDNRMPVSSRLSTQFYWYGDNSWAYTHGGVQNEYYYAKSVSIPLGVWGFFCVVYNGSNVSIYRQGVYEGQQASTGTANWSQGLKIGSWAGGNSYTWLGKISNVLFYDRALSAAEVLQNYYAGLQRLIPTNGLVLWLDGNNTDKQVATPTIANDMSGNNYNGTMLNTVSLSRDGQRSFSFDGVDDNINLGNVLNNTTGDYSVSMWVKIPSSSVAFTTLFSKKGIAAANAGYAMYYNGSIQKLMWSNGDSVTAQEYYTNSVIPLDQWINIVCVRDINGVTKGYFYINNIKYEISTNPTGLNVTNTYDFTVGKNSNGTLYLNGNVGDIRVYNRVLTVSEITTIYTATKSRYGL